MGVPVPLLLFFGGWGWGQQTQKLVLEEGIRKSNLTPRFLYLWLWKLP